jgi:hypothetical protein
MAAATALIHEGRHFVIKNKGLTLRIECRAQLLGCNNFHRDVKEPARH